MRRSDVIVAGGGIAGLVAAWTLHRQGVDVLVLEEASVVGGNIRTIEHDGFRMETGPHSFMGSADNVWRLVADAAMDADVEEAAPEGKYRYIYRDGRLFPLPLSPGQFLGTKLLSARAKVRLALEPFMPGGARDEDTAWDFFIRRFGVEAATYIMSPFISGVYAGDAKMLGAKASFPKFWNFEYTHGSMILGAIRYMLDKRKRLKAQGLTPKKGMYTFKGGLGRITEKLASDLGERVICGRAVEKITRSNGCYTITAGGETFEATAFVSAVPPHRAAPLLGAVCPGLIAPIAAVPMSPVAVAHWSQDASGARIPPGFGFLVPRLYDVRVLGTLFPSQLFTGRAPDGQKLLVSFYGGMTDKNTAILSDDELRELAMKDHEKAFGARPDPSRLFKILRYPAAIPQLLPDHPQRMALVASEVSKTPGLFLAGNYLTGVSIDHAVGSGFTAAEKCADFLSGIRANNHETDDERRA